MPQHVQRSMLFNFYTGFGRFRRSAWSKKWYSSGRTSRIASDAPDVYAGMVTGIRVFMGTFCLVFTVCVRCFLLHIHSKTSPVRRSEHSFPLETKQGSRH